MVHPIDQLIVDWLRGFPNRNTRDSYERDVYAWAHWCAAANVDPLAPSRDDAFEYRDHMEAESLRPSTIARRLAACRGFYRRYASGGGIAINPFEEVKGLGGGGDSTTPWLDRGGLQQLLVAARSSSPRDFILTALLGVHGLRVSEAIEADVANVGESAGRRVLRIVRKGSKDGVVPLAPAVVDVLDPYLAGRRGGPLLVRLDADNQPVDPPQPITRSAADKRVKKLAIAAGVNPKISPHSLRHSFVTLTLQGGARLHVVQFAVGHKSPTTTQRYNREREALEASPALELAAAVL